MSNVFSVNHKTMFNWFTFHGSILKVLFIFRDPSGIVFFYFTTWGTISKYFLPLTQWSCHYLTMISYNSSQIYDFGMIHNVLPLS